jgi:hypothetical protein
MVPNSRVFQKRVVGRIFGSKRDEVKEGWENCKMKAFP